MTPGIGDRFKKIAKAVAETERTIQTTQAILQGRAPPTTPSAYGPPQTTPSPPPNDHCEYCGGLVARGTPKCPNCNAPMK